MINLLSSIITFNRKTIKFDGLSDDVTIGNKIKSAPCRIYRMRHDWSYGAEGNLAISTHRVFLNGKLEDYPTISIKDSIVVDGITYIVDQVNQVLSTTKHHIEIDVTLLS